MIITICNKELGIVKTVDNLLDLFNFMKTLRCFEDKHHTNTIYNVYLVVANDTTDDDDMDIESLMKDINHIIKPYCKLKTEFNTNNPTSATSMMRSVKEAYDQKNKNNQME